MRTPDEDQHHRPEQQPDSELRRRPLGVAQRHAGQRHQHVADDGNEQRRRHARPHQAAGAVALPPATEHPHRDRQLHDGADDPQGIDQRSAQAVRDGDRRQQDQRDRQRRDEGVPHRVAAVLGPGLGMDLRTPRKSPCQDREHGCRRESDDQRCGGSAFAHRRRRAVPGQRESGQAHDDGVPAGEQVLHTLCVTVQ
jgi:hypothetical protein